ncbi:hypothetical protein CVT26_011560 [Gymnopilus dilepis]|uniref:Uncharacterized protein n=1 Tax=Gymnopilus dilepis TaxID=231916 RepID=A0A409WZK6_9AGAR|nr:hypothetical protein CVT26_011560 [Gymnopilus dilepis]
MPSNTSLEPYDLLSSTSKAYFTICKLENRQNLVSIRRYRANSRKARIGLGRVSSDLMFRDGTNAIGKGRRRDNAPLMTKLTGNTAGA